MNQYIYLFESRVNKLHSNGIFWASSKDFATLSYQRVRSNSVEYEATSMNISSCGDVVEWELLFVCILHVSWILNCICLRGVWLRDSMNYLWGMCSAIPTDPSNQGVFSCQPGMERGGRKSRTSQLVSLQRRRRRSCVVTFALKHSYIASPCVSHEGA